MESEEDNHEEEGEEEEDKEEQKIKEKQTGEEKGKQKSIVEEKEYSGEESETFEVPSPVAHFEGTDKVDCSDGEITDTYLRNLKLKI